MCFLEAYGHGDLLQRRGSFWSIHGFGDVFGVLGLSMDSKKTFRNTRCLFGFGMFWNVWSLEASAFIDKKHPSKSKAIDDSARSKVLDLKRAIEDAWAVPIICSATQNGRATGINRDARPT